MPQRAEAAGLNHGYLENQLFSTAIQRGKDSIWRRGVPNSGGHYLARASEQPWSAYTREELVVHTFTPH